MESLRLPGEQAVQVARIARGAPVALRTVTARGTIGGPEPRLERTSTMCQRVDCLVAINGDFFDSGMPVGAVADGARMIRSPRGKHHALMIDPGGKLRAGSMRWSAKLVSTDLAETPIDGVNVPRDPDSLVLYTPTFGPSTQTNAYGAELVIRFVSPRGRAPAIGETAIVRLDRYAFAAGDTPIPRDGAVLSGHGTAATALASLWRRVQRDLVGRDALVRIETERPVSTAIGGSPILLRDGAVWFADQARVFVRGSAPRTIMGWNARGDVWLVTVDGRQRGWSRGMSLAEAAALMLGLGATDAINLDGGGSTTFVVRGEVVNHPSDRLVGSGAAARIVSTVAPGARAANVERPVANALVVVPAGGTQTARSPVDLTLRLPRPSTVALPAPAATDPASNPDSSLPAVLGLPASDSGGRTATGPAIAVVLNALTAAVLLRRARRRVRQAA